MAVVSGMPHTRTMRSYRYVVCDVFTDRPLEGNPLAVFIDAEGLDPTTMQRLARETNLSETTFVLAPERGGDAKVRIFTPTRELPFAGHPTLGTAVVLAETMQRAEITLELGVGPVAVRIERERGQATFGWMRQPTPSAAEAAGAPAILDALGVERSALPLLMYDNGPRHVLVALESPLAVAELHPSFQELGRAVQAGVLAFHFTGDKVHARYFAPYAGVDEDPATGSAAGPLVLHLVRHAGWQLGRELSIEQGHEIGRPSRLVARVTEVDGVLGVEVGGSAVIVARGDFLVP
jgi:trans-2,3-dihydro-3-hydroxyanthranilate isomerase